MLKERFRIYRLTNFIGDLIFAVVLLVAFAFGLSGEVNVAPLTAWAVTTWCIAALPQGLYNLDRVERLEQKLGKLFFALLSFSVLQLLGVFALKTEMLSANWIVWYCLSVSVTVVLWHVVLMTVLKRLRAREHHYRKAIIVGNGRMTEELADVLVTHRGYGYKLLGVYNDSMTSGANGLVEEARKLISARSTEDVFCTLPVTEKETIAELVMLSEKNFVNFRLVPDMSPLLQRSLVIDTMGLLPVISLRHEPFEKFFNRFLKRSFDVVTSMFVFVFVLSWLTPLLFVLIKLESKGPLFYKQKRSGIGYTPFTIFKFRTMRVTETDDEFKQAQTNDTRITNLGKILRKLNIDELPQFWNVLKGEMSVVGPRPHPLKLNETYKDLIERFMSRHRVLPGLTGLAQVRGFRGNTENIQRMQKRVQADLYYIENWSFWLDVKIILLTLRNMIVGDKHAY